MCGITILCHGQSRRLNKNVRCAVTHQIRLQLCKGRDGRRLQLGGLTQIGGEVASVAVAHSGGDGPLGTAAAHRAHEIGSQRGWGATGHFTALDGAVTAIRGDSTRLQDRFAQADALGTARVVVGG